MRVLVLLFLMINLAVAAYFNWDKITGRTALHMAQPEMAPEKLTIVTPEALAVLPKAPELPTSSIDTELTQAAVPVAQAAAPAPAPILSCYTWGNFTAKDLPKAQALLSRLGVKGKVTKQSRQEAKRYWVYIPSQPSDDDAISRAQSLKQLGIDNFVTNDARWPRTISLGLFKDERLADELLINLRAKGLSDVMKLTRQQGEAMQLHLSNITDIAVESIAKEKANFPSADFSNAPC